MDPFFAFAIFVFGLAFGSFLNVCIHRLPRRILLYDEFDRVQKQMDVLSSQESGVGSQQEQLALLQNRAAELREQIANCTVNRPPRSYCPSCKAPIAAYDNIPVLSWLMLRGRCRRCQAPISPRYLAVELITALLFLACLWRFGLTLSTIKFCALSFLLLGLIFTDAEHKLLPDSLTLPGLLIGLGFSLVVPVNDTLTLFLPEMVPLPRWLASWRLLSLGDATLGAVIGSLFIYGVGVLYLRARGIEGMGFGDVKLMAMVGAFLGLKLTLITIFGASLAGSLVGLAMILQVWVKRTKRRMARGHETAAVARKRAWQSARTVYQHYQMPFGVFLGGMAIVALFFGNALLRWYWRLYL